MSSQHPTWPAPQWLALERFDALRDDELRDLLATSHRLIYEKLPKRLREDLASGKTTAKRIAAKKKPKAVAKKRKVVAKKRPVAKKSSPSKTGKSVAKKR